VHLAKCLHEDDWERVRKNLDRRPVEGVTEKASQEEIVHILKKYGVTDSQVELWGTGKPMREFLWSEEMADASVYIMEHVDFEDLKGNGLEIRNCHINIGTGKEISIGDLAKLVVEVVGYKGKLVFDASKPDGTMRKLTDPSKLHSLGWCHKVEVDEGVERLYRWYIS